MQNRLSDWLDPGVLQHQRRRLLGVILLLAFLLRLAGGVVVDRQTVARHGTSQHFLFPDSDNIWAFVENLVTTGEYVDESNRRAWRTPLYPLLLTPLRLLGVTDPRLLRLVNVGLDLLNVLLAYALARRLAGVRAGLAAALLLAVYPFFIYFSNLVLTETLAVTCVLLLTLVANRLVEQLDAEQGRPLRFAALTGLVLALAALAKPSLAGLGGMLALFLLARVIRSGRRGVGELGGRGVGANRLPSIRCLRTRTLGAIAAITFAFFAGMSPWWIRNGVIYEAFVPLSTMGGYTMYESNSERADGGPNHGKIVFPPEWEVVMTALTLEKWQVEKSLPLSGNSLGISQASFINMGPRYWFEVPPQIIERLKKKYPFARLVAGPLSIWIDQATLCRSDRAAMEKCEDGLKVGPAAAADLEREADAILRRESLRWIRDNPRDFLALMPRKFLRTWNVWPNYDAASGWIYKAVSMATYLPVMLLAVYGLWHERARWRTVGLLILPALYLAALHSVFMGSLRYRLPVMGCLIVLAALGLEHLFARLDIRRARE